MKSRSQGPAGPFTDHYGVLGVTLRTGPAELQRAYRVAVKKYHPDAVGDRSGRMIRAVNEAYAVLRDPAKRRKYDLAWVAHEVDPRGGRRERRRRRSRSDSRRTVFCFVRATGLAACLVVAALLLAAAVAGAGSRPERMGADKVGNAAPVLRADKRIVVARTPFEYAVPFESEGGERTAAPGGADEADPE